MTTRLRLCRHHRRSQCGQVHLINALVGSKVAIVTPKVQTTRMPVRGIAMAGETQIVFVDTPGIFRPPPAGPRHGDQRLGRRGRSRRRAPDRGCRRSVATTTAWAHATPRDPGRPEERQGKKKALDPEQDRRHETHRSAAAGGKFHAEGFSRMCSWSRP
jgi:hypothetical protein